MPASNPSHPRALLLVLALVTALVTVGAPAGAAADGGQPDGSDVPQWAPAASATVHPGVQMVTDGNQCTANFVFYERTDDGQFDLYLGYAAHCAMTGPRGSTNGCVDKSLKLGTPVTIQGADHPGSLAHSSWLVMQAVDETDDHICAVNDFALVRIDPRDHHKVNPSLPFYGGPQGVNSVGAKTATKVYSYGNSMLRFGVAALSPKEGYSVVTGGWEHTVYTLTPGVWGDSGSAFLDAEGRALGSLSTVGYAPLAGSNGVTDIKRAVEYANANSPLAVTLAEGTEPFTGGWLP